LIGKNRKMPALTEQFFANLPSYSTGSHLVVSDEFINLATRIDQKNSEGKKVLLLTSLRAGEGKTTVSANLAIALAHLNKRVLLIDADFKRPALHAIFNLNPLYGLSDILSQNIPVETFIPRNFTANEVHLITSGKKLYSDERFPKAQMHTLLTSLKEYYDYILLDSAPMTVKSQFKTLLKLVDGIYLVVRNDNLLFLNSSTLTKLPRSNKKFQGLIINNYQSKFSQLVFN